MPKIYENIKTNFTGGMEEFKEHAVKIIQETYGRVKALDIFDFHETEDKYVATAHYEGEENIPAEQAPGDPTSEETSAAAEAARQTEDADKEKAATEAAENADRIRAIVKEGKAVSQDDADMAVTLGISDELMKETDARLEAIRVHFDATAVLPMDERADGFFEFQIIRKDVEVARGSIPELEERVASEAPHEYADSDSVKDDLPEDDGAISKNAQVLIDTHSLDSTLIKGTGFNGKITSEDVNAYLDAQNTTNAPLTENANANSDEQSNA